MKSKIEAVVKKMCDKAESCGNATDALKYTQAMLNAAHAYVTIKGN